MSGERPRDVASIQNELNRQALVDIGKRLTGLECRFMTLFEEIKDLQFQASTSLETAIRVQGMLKKLVDKDKSSESQDEPEDPD